MVKVIFELDDHWSGSAAEGMWTKPAGEDLYEIHNVPSYTYEADYLDVVRAKVRERGQWPHFEEVVKESGHKTIRVFFHEKDPKRNEEFLKGLNKLHAYFENANGKLYSLDLEPDCPFEEVIKILDAAQKADILGYETTRDKRKTSRKRLN